MSFKSKENTLEIPTPLRHDLLYLYRCLKSAVGLDFSHGASFLSLTS